MLSYIAEAPQVQLGFLLVFAICFVAFLINHRVSKAQQWDHEEKAEQRRDHLMAISAPRNPPQTVEHSG